MIPQGRAEPPPGRIFSHVTATALLSKIINFKLAVSFSEILSGIRDHIPFTENYFSW